MSLVNVVSRSAINIPVTDKENSQKESMKDIFSQLVKDKKEEYLTRIQNGTFEQSFQIGAGSYTEKEWKKLLMGFDAAEAKLRESTEEAKKKAQKADEIKTSDKDNKDDESKAKSIEMLFAEFTTATYPSNDKNIPDNIYYTFYTEDGIYCRKQGQSEFEWQISLEDKAQYEKVMSYLQGLDLQDNLKFACHENFWQDFLNDKVDMDKFNDFLETRVTDGMPNYLNVYETGVNIDIKAVQYSKYMNLPDFVKNMCYTSEEALETFFRNR